MSSARLLLAIAGVAAFLAMVAGPSQAQPAVVREDEAFAVEYWRVAQEELFADIELTAAQQQGIDAIVASAEAERARFREIKEELQQARAQGDTSRSEELAAELSRVQAEFFPEARIDAMRAVLREDQLETFDKNRRLRQDRLLAEARKRKARRGKPRGRPTP